MKERKLIGSLKAGVIIAISAMLGEVLATPIAVIVVLILLSTGTISSVVGTAISFIGVILGTIIGSCIVSRRGILPDKVAKAAVIGATIAAVVSLIMGGATLAIGALAGESGVSFIMTIIEAGMRWVIIYAVSLSVIKVTKKRKLEEGSSTH
ncbi:MAG: hypothetical protein PHG66_03240 [Candidatus Colwellbacteria bacterium]|nr:hypothetical protein [Candidatus Colwellbacteria bacterium]